MIVVIIITIIIAMTRPRRRRRPMFVKNRRSSCVESLGKISTDVMLDIAHWNQIRTLNEMRAHI